MQFQPFYASAVYAAGNAAAVYAASVYSPAACAHHHAAQPQLTDPNPNPAASAYPAHMLFWQT